MTTTHLHLTLASGSAAVAVWDGAPLALAAAGLALVVTIGRTAVRRGALLPALSGPVGAGALTLSQDACLLEAPRHRRQLPAHTGRAPAAPAAP